MDQGSGAKIMYLDLYKGLNIRPEDLTAYDSPLVSFDRKVVIPRGQIKLSIQVGWFKSGGGGLHRGGRIFPLHSHCGQALTLHQKVKYLVGGQIEEIIGSQSTARQCLVAAILH